MALLRACRAYILGLPLESAYSWGLNRAIFIAAAKKGFTGEAEKAGKTSNGAGVYYLGDDMAFKDEKGGVLRFTIGSEAQTKEGFERQVVARFGKSFPKAWKEGLAYVKKFDKETLLSAEEFFREVYRPRRDELAKNGPKRLKKNREQADSMIIKIDDLTGSEIQLFLKEHLEDMIQQSQPESMHALGVEELRKPEITLWSAWDKSELLGCGALKELNTKHGEIKSMRTVSAHRRRGVGSMLLSHILEEAKRRNYERISLETGSSDTFAPARNLYAKFGFRECPPFADYAEDPSSFFMTKKL